MNSARRFTTRWTLASRCALLSALAGLLPASPIFAKTAKGRDPAFEKEAQRYIKQYANPVKLTATKNELLFTKAAAKRVEPSPVAAPGNKREIVIPLNEAGAGASSSGASPDMPAPPPTNSESGNGGM